jgi:hypothetical protein
VAAAGGLGGAVARQAEVKEDLGAMLVEYLAEFVEAEAGRWADVTVDLVVVRAAHPVGFAEAMVPAGEAQTVACGVAAEGARPEVAMADALGSLVPAGEAQKVAQRAVPVMERVEVPMEDGAERVVTMGGGWEVVCRAAPVTERVGVPMEDAAESATVAQAVEVTAEAAVEKEVREVALRT